MVSHKSLNDNKSPQVCRTLFSILADLDNAVVWMITSRPLIPSFMYRFLLLIISMAHVSIMNSILMSWLYILTAGFPVQVSIFWWLYGPHQLQLLSPLFSCFIIFQFSSKVLVFIFLFAFFQFYPVVSWNGKVHLSAGSLFCCWLSQGLVVWWSVCILKSQRSLCISFSRTDSGLCIYHLFVW